MAWHVLPKALILKHVTPSPKTEPEQSIRTYHRDETMQFEQKEISLKKNAHIYFRRTTTRRRNERSESRESRQQKKEQNKTGTERRW